MLLSCVISHAQTFTHCDVYQFANGDSTKKFISLKQTFAANGKLLSEQYDRYMRTVSEGCDNGTYFYFYKDTLLLRRSYCGADMDSTKMICHYNKKNQLIQEEYFTFERRMKKSVDKGFGRPGGCIVEDSDFEKNRTWEKVSVINYKYDAAGRLIEYNSPKLHFSTQNRYTWLYDSLGRISKYYSYDFQRLIWVEEYTYFKDAYTFRRTWYDYSGKPNDYDVFTFTYKINAQGKVTEEKVTDEKGELISSETMEYDSSGNLIRTTAYNGKGKEEMTHLFVYY